MRTAPTAIFAGNKIRNRREKLGIYQGDLARPIGKSVSSINRFERNKTEHRASDLYAIARALRCKMEEFFG
jgi:transcriptional regulator with XRE-family HTH domain